MTPIDLKTVARKNVMIKLATKIVFKTIEIQTILLNNVLQLILYNFLINMNDILHFKKFYRRISLQIATYFH